MNKNYLSYIILCALGLALCVIMLGAYTRLTDAGLGCPDWPGCYGQMLAPHNKQHISAAQQAFPNAPVAVSKAWTEMVHRYIAGTLGILIILIAGLSFGQRKQNTVGYAPMILVLLVFFQAALGMWTVTLKLLPVVVMGHLLGGFAIASTLWLLWLRNQGVPKAVTPLHTMRGIARIGLIVLIIQITLGAWVSSNYAALICPDFPYCQGKLIPPMDLLPAFNVLSPIGVNYQGGVLDNIARVTIHMMHRFGAVLTALLLASFAIVLFRRATEKLDKTLALIVLGLLAAQVTLGILNVRWFLPLPVAVAHNGVAVLLLLSLIAANYRLRVGGANVA